MENCNDDEKIEVTIKVSSDINEDEKTMLFKNVIEIFEKVFGGNSSMRISYKTSKKKLNFNDDVE